METKFFYEEALIGVHDSMELDSERDLAHLIWNDKIAVEIAVEGEVRVAFNGEIYHYPSGFPDELLELFHKGKASSNKRVEVINNNWFELYVYEKKGDEWVFAGVNDIIDGDFKSAGDIYDTLNEYLQEYIATKSE